MRKISKLTRSAFVLIWLVAWLGLMALAPACRSKHPQVEPTSPGPQKGTDPSSGKRNGSDPFLPVDRIAIVGASVSAGFGGLAFGDAFAAAAPRSKVDSWASTFLFRDPVGDTKRQLAQAAAMSPTVVVALDLLFWDVYGQASAAWHAQALDGALAGLEALRAKGAWIIIGDVPLITTASELMLPKEAIPDGDTLAKANGVIAGWAKRERVLFVPLALWTEPLRQGADVELSPGERVPASSLMAVDGLHANPLGTWYVLDKLDHFIERLLPGTAKDALVFARPKD
jgi:hypothetical protein